MVCALHHSFCTGKSEPVTESALLIFRIPFKLLTSTQKRRPSSLQAAPARGGTSVPASGEPATGSVASLRSPAAMSAAMTGSAPERSPAHRRLFRDGGQAVPGNAFGRYRPASPAATWFHLRGTTLREAFGADRQRCGCRSQKRIARRPRVIASSRVMPPTAGRERAAFPSGRRGPREGVSMGVPGFASARRMAWQHVVGSSGAAGTSRVGGPAAFSCGSRSQAAPERRQEHPPPGCVARVLRARRT